MGTFPENKPTEPYCQTNPKFDAFLRRMGEMHDRKNAGYAVEGDPMQNFRLSERFGIPMYQGLAVRISDKMNRWLNIVGDANKDKVGESIEDTSLDTAVYLGLFLIALAEYKSLHFADAEELGTPREEAREEAQDAGKQPLPEDDGYVTSEEDLSPTHITIGWTPEQYELMPRNVENVPKDHNNDYFARAYKP